MRISFRLPMTAAGVALASCLATSALAQSFVMKFGTATVHDPQHEYTRRLIGSIPGQTWEPPVDAPAAACA